MNKVKPWTECFIPHEAKIEPVLNDVGEEVGSKVEPIQVVPMNEATDLPLVKTLSCDPSNPVEFAKYTEVMQKSSTNKTDALMQCVSGIDAADAVQQSLNFNSPF